LTRIVAKTDYQDYLDNPEYKYFLGFSRSIYVLEEKDGEVTFWVMLSQTSLQQAGFPKEIGIYSSSSQALDSRFSSTYTSVFI
jgi:hypothetical protein